MEIFIAECSAIYSGRGDTKLERGLRAIMIKSDGSVSIHNDVSNKPLNYMKTATKETHLNSAKEEVWTFDARHESLQITLHEIHSAMKADLLGKDEPGLIRDGTEAQLQKWVFENTSILGEGYLPVEREFDTGAGAVDILALSPDGAPVAIEIKRVAMLGAVDQIKRYVESMKTLAPEMITHPKTGERIQLDFSETIGFVAALDLRPKMLALAEKRGVPTIVIPHYWRTNESIDPDLQG